MFQFIHSTMFTLRKMRGGKCVKRNVFNFWTLFFSYAWQHACVCVWFVATWSFMFTVFFGFLKAWSCVLVHLNAQQDSHSHKYIPTMFHHGRIIVTILISLLVKMVLVINSSKQYCRMQRLWHRFVHRNPGLVVIFPFLVSKCIRRFVHDDDLRRNLSRFVIVAR